MIATFARPSFGWSPPLAELQKPYDKFLKFENFLWSELMGRNLRNSTVEFLKFRPISSVEFLKFRPISSDHKAHKLSVYCSICNKLLTFAEHMGNQSAAFFLLAKCRQFAEFNLEN